MGWGTGNLGGGSGGLNFKVVGYATEAELLADTPKENTIGIITTNKITGWMFAAADPAEPVEGMIYITTGTESNIAFNALKKNGIQVYPLSAKQYVSGALVDVTAMSYQGWEWVSWWTGYIVFDRPSQSFSAISDKLHIVDSAFYSPINDKNPYIELMCGSGSNIARAWQWETAVDFSKYKTLEVTGYSTGGKFGVASGLKGIGDQLEVTELASMNFSRSDSVHTLDISGIDTNAYIGFYTDVNKSVFVKKVKLM